MAAQITAPAISFRLQPSNLPRVQKIQERMAAPLPRSITAAMANAMRRGGEGSVEEQFKHQAEMAMAVSLPWQRTNDFGTRKAPAKTLHDKGAYEAAWTGRGAGSITKVEGRGVSIGVDPHVFPQARMFQRSGITMIKVTPKSRLYIGITFGVWLKKSTRQIRVEGRPISINRGMLERQRKIVSGYYLNGEGTGYRDRDARGRFTKAA